MYKIKRFFRRITYIIIFFLITSIVVFLLKVAVNAYNDNTTCVEQTAAVVGINEEELRELISKAESITNAFDSINRLRNKVVDLFVSGFISLGDVSDTITETADEDTLNNLTAFVLGKLEALKASGANLADTDLNSMADEITKKISEKMSADEINKVLNGGNVDTLFDSLIDGSKVTSFFQQIIEFLKSKMTGILGG